MDIDTILENALSVAQKDGWDAAARFLAPWRKHYVSQDLARTGNVCALTAVVTMQVEALRKAQKDDTACSVGEWFHHVLHDLPAAAEDETREPLREPLSKFFREYAKALCGAGRYEEMRLAMRSALDATIMLPLAIATLVHLYAPLEHRCSSIEDEPPRQWLLKRYAECLALLDFAGLGGTPFRASLDDYQAALRDETARAALFEKVSARNRDNKDPALQLLTRLFEAHFMNKETT